MKLIVFVLCGMLPLFLALTAQPLAAAIMALLGTAFWLRFGPRPRKG